jgi:hypothetical protein
MKRTIWLTVAILSLWSVGAAAQVYESKDKSGGPVYSDTPSRGAKPVDMPPPNVVSPQQQAPVPPPPAPPPFSYGQLAIVAPVQQGTIHSNTGAFEVQLSADPALRLGDAFVLTLDGNALPNRYTSANIALSAQDYASAAAATHEHSLSVAIVDSNGKVMIKSGPVSFYVSRTTVREGRGRR